MHFKYINIYIFIFRFDGQFVESWLLRQGIAPDVIPNGSKLMTIILTALNIRIIDSFIFLPMALSRLPGCFGLSELKKGYFPHLFNVKGNQMYHGPIPEVHYYNPDMMSPTARSSFLEWHNQQKTDTFDFQEEILAYCRCVLKSLIFLLFILRKAYIDRKIFEFLIYIYIFFLIDQMSIY